MLSEIGLPASVVGSFTVHWIPLVKFSTVDGLRISEANVPPPIQSVEFQQLRLPPLVK
jgi:hypothetical protein